MSEERTKLLQIGDKIGKVNVADEQRGILISVEVLYGGAINRATRDGVQFLPAAEYAKKLQEFWSSDAGKEYVIYDPNKIIEDHKRAKQMYENYFAKLRKEEAAKREEIRENDKQRVLENMAQDKNSDAAKLMKLKKEAEEKRIAAEKAAQVPTTPLKLESETPRDKPAVEETVKSAVSEEETSEPQTVTAPEEKAPVQERPAQQEPQPLKADEPEPATEEQEKAPVSNERIDEPYDDPAVEEPAPRKEKQRMGLGRKPASSEQKNVPAGKELMPQPIRTENTTQTIVLVFPKWVKAVAIIALIMLILLTAVVILQIASIYLPMLINGKQLIGIGALDEITLPFPLPASPGL